MEQPRYIIRPSEIRVLVPQALKVSGLCLLFYIGVWLNAFLLQIDIPPLINIATIAGLGLLVIIDLIVQYVKTRKVRLELYLDRTIRMPQNTTLMWTEAGMPTTQSNIIDRIFKTSKISLGSVDLPYVKKAEKMKNYIEQYRQYGVYYSKYPKQNA